MTNIILWYKAKLRDKFVLEMKVTEVSWSTSYRDRVRYPYEFVSEEKLIEDFREFVMKEFGESL